MQPALNKPAQRQCVHFLPGTKHGNRCRSRLGLQYGQLIINNSSAQTSTHTIVNTSPTVTRTTTIISHIHVEGIGDSCLSHRRFSTNPASYHQRLLVPHSSTCDDWSVAIYTKGYHSSDLNDSISTLQQHRGLSLSISVDDLEDISPSFHA